MFTPSTTQTKSEFLYNFLLPAGGKKEDSTELLSRLIADLNERFGLNLTDADRIWFEQQQQHYANDLDLMEVARANDYDNFEMHFVPLVADGLIESQMLYPLSYGRNGEKAILSCWRAHITRE